MSDRIKSLEDELQEIYQENNLLHVENLRLQKDI